MTTHKEEDLWRNFRNGNEQAFAEIYHAYFFVLYSYGYHIAKEEELVKDCIQILFGELWKSRQNLKDTTSIKYYLLKAMRRKVYYALRKKKNFLSTDFLSDSYDFEITFSPEFDLITHQVSTQQQEKLLQALNQLSNRQKEAITLLYLEGLSYKEVAEIMSLKVRSVYNLIHTALETLKKYLTRSGLWLALVMWLVK